MTGLLATVNVLVVVYDNNVLHVAVSWEEAAIWQSLIDWAEREFDCRLPKDRTEALTQVETIMRSGEYETRAYHYDVFECRVSDL